MEKRTSKKILPWKKKDIILLVITYIINTAIFMGIFATLFYLQSGREVSFVEFFAGGKNVPAFSVIISLLIATVFLYFFFEDRNFLKSASNSEMLFLILQIGLIACFLIEHFINANLRPVAFVAVATLFLCGTRYAVFNNLIFSIFLILFECFMRQNASVDFILLSGLLVKTICSGTIAIYLLKGMYSRMKLIAFSFILSVPIVLNAVLLDGFLPEPSIFKNTLYSLCSGPLAILALFFFLPIFEFVFKKITYFKLAELTDHKAKYIRKMIAHAPGTFNHSIVVSNLAEACATAIGEDALLARTCAYYHDIGKLRRPEFFKENQVDNDNPHDDITPELSANIIKSHTIDGYHYALKNHLPKEIAEVSIQHHGTLPILYFYDKARKFTDGEVSLAQFCYAGPKPQTKIAAIIMIADSCEAASRLLANRSRENVNKTVKSIVNDRMKLGQFDECEITLKEIDIIIHTITNTLSGVYHNRIEYPKISVEDIDLNSPSNQTQS